jgi:hypothetical protein
MLDALAASDARERLAAQLPGGAAAAEALVPRGPAEEEARERALVLMTAIGGRLSAPGAPFKVGAGAGEDRASGLAGSGGAGPRPRCAWPVSPRSPAPPSPPSPAPPCLQMPQGSGPWGLPTPGDVQQLVASLQEGAAAAWPQLQQVHPRARYGTARLPPGDAPSPDKPAPIPPPASPPPDAPAAGRAGSSPGGDQQSLPPLRRAGRQVWVRLARGAARGGGAARRRRRR